MRPLRANGFRHLLWLLGIVVCACSNSYQVELPQLAPGHSFQSYLIVVPRWSSGPLAYAQALHPDALQVTGLSFPASASEQVQILFFEESLAQLNLEEGPLVLSDFQGIQAANTEPCVLRARVHQVLENGLWQPAAANQHRHVEWLRCQVNVRQRSDDCFLVENVSQVTLPGLASSPRSGLALPDGRLLMLAEDGSLHMVDEASSQGLERANRWFAEANLPPTALWLDHQQRLWLALAPGHIALMEEVSIDAKPTLVLIPTTTTTPRMVSLSGGLDSQGQLEIFGLNAWSKAMHFSAGRGPRYIDVPTTDTTGSTSRTIRWVAPGKAVLSSVYPSPFWLEAQGPMRLRPVALPPHNGRGHRDASGVHIAASGKIYLGAELIGPAVDQAIYRQEGSESFVLMEAKRRFGQIRAITSLQDGSILTAGASGVLRGVGYHPECSINDVTSDLPVLVIPLLGDRFAFATRQRGEGMVGVSFYRWYRQPKN